MLGAYEKEFNLPAGVLGAVIAQESSGNPYATRYEPGFFEKYIEFRTRASLGGVWPVAVDEDTERHGRATSWGLMQIMGQTARELGFDGTHFAELTEPSLGVRFGSMLLKRKLAVYGPDLSQALSAYNAGTPTAANIETYVRPIMNRMNG